MGADRGLTPDYHIPTTLLPKLLGLSRSCEPCFRATSGNGTSFAEDTDTVTGEIYLVDQFQTVVSKERFSFELLLLKDASGHMWS